MNYSDITIFALAKTKMAYHSQNQSVISENIANIDTPGYQAKQLEPLNFKKLMRARPSIDLARTHSAHIEGKNNPRLSVNSQLQEDFYERIPVDNNVNLEEQMGMLSANSFEYQKTVNLYRKAASLIRTAVGNRG